jgi:capsular polysaccharide biosynthesis protein
MALRELVHALLRRWWLIVIVPVLLIPILLVRARNEPYQSRLNATVLLPGDTEIPGSSERPELMVMDDVPGLIGSQAFAAAVAKSLQAAGSSLTSDQIHGMISATRYSRIVTIAVTGDNSDVVLAVAKASGTVLPDVVNQNLVAPNSTPATVNVIDQPSAPTKRRPNEKLIFAALLLLGAAVGAGLALLADGWSKDAERERVTAE